jgi:hypothetical protein
MWKKFMGISAICLCSVFSFAGVIFNPIDCGIQYGLSGRYNFPNGITSIRFDPQDILQCPISGTVVPGEYDLYVRVAPDPSKEEIRFFEIGLGDSISYVRYKQPTGPQWIGPIHFKTTVPAGSIDLHGTGEVMVDCFRLAPAGTAAPTQVEKPIPNIDKKNLKTLWLDWPAYPAWVTDRMPVAIRVRTAGTGSAKVTCRMFDFDHREVGSFAFTVNLGRGLAMQEIPVPKKFGPYLLRFFVSIPEIPEYEFQRIVTRVSSPLEFTCDRFGGHGNFPLLKLMGGGWARLWDSGGGNTHWSQVEPEKGKFIWDDNLPPAPIKTLAVLEKTPSWVKKSYFDDSSEWLNYVRRTVEHFRGKIPVYEIFNEPYGDTTDETFRKHVAVVAKTAAVIRQTDPKAMITSGGPPEEIPPGLGWWKKMLKCGLIKPLDYISVHLYFGGGGTYPIDQDLRFDAYVTSLRRMIDENGGKEKMLWDTESGLCPMESFYIGRPVTYGLWSGQGFTPRDPVPYRVGAAMAGRYLLLHFWHNVRWNYYHTTGACFGNSWALCDFDETPLPAAAAFAQLTRFFADARPDGKPNLPQGLWGLRFKKDNLSLAALWSVSLKPGEKRFLRFAPNPQIKLLDLFCNPIEMKDRLEIGIYPVIFMGTSEDLNKTLSQLKVESELDKSISGQAKISQRLTAPNIKDPATLTASSTAAGYTVDPVRDENTVSAGTAKDSWSSKFGKNPQWLEYRWSGPQTINRLRCAWPPGDIPDQYKAEWYDGAVWHPCSGTTDWRSPGMPVEDYTIQPVTTDRFRMIIQNKNGRPARVAEFAAFHIPRLTPPITEMAEIWSKNFKPSAEGFIRDWLVCGPFPSPGNRYAQDKKLANWNADLLDTCWIYGSGHGEPVIKPYVGQEHFAWFPGGTSAKWKPMDIRVAWQPIHTGTDNYLDLGKSFTNSLITSPGHMVEQCIGYAACYLDVPADVNASLLIGSDDGYKIWLDENIVAEKIIFRGASPDQEKFPVTLTKGKHRLLIKVHNDIGGHGLYLRFQTPDGKPVTNLTIRLAP